MMNKRIVALLIVVVSCLVILGCASDDLDMPDEQTRKIEFALNMRLESSIGRDYAWLLDVERDINIIFRIELLPEERHLANRDNLMYSIDNPPRRVIFWPSRMASHNVLSNMTLFAKELGININDYMSGTQNAERLRFFNIGRDWERLDRLWRQFDPSIQETIQASVDMEIRLVYVRNMCFNNSIGHDFDTGMPFGPGIAVEIIFVHNEEEALALFPGRDWSMYDGRENPPDVMMVWPDAEKSQGAINGVHHFARRRDIDIEKLSLEYPITLEDLVDNWESVNDFLDLLDSSARSTIRNNAARHGANAFVPVEE